MEPISVALSLAQFVPSILRYFGAGNESVEVANKVVGIATQVTGAKTPEEAIAALKADQQLQITFQEEVMKNEAQLQQIYLNDISDARKRDIAIRAAGQKNIRADVMSAGAFLVVALIVFWVWSKPDVNDYVKGIITLVLGRFLGYTDQIFQFEFGAVRNLIGKDKK